MAALAFLLDVMVLPKAIMAVTAWLFMEVAVEAVLEEAVKQIVEALPEQTVETAHQVILLALT